jgi:hypothetical protein
MSSIARLKVIKGIFKNAGYITTLVDQLISNKQSGETSESKPSLEYKQVPISLGPAATVMMPPNVVNPDGSVDVIINFKGGNSPAVAATTGRKAVMVSIYEPEGGKYKFGNYSQYNHNFVNKAVDTIVSSLQKANPDKIIKRGKLTITGWSAGGSALKQVLVNEDKVKGGVDEVFFSDALHSGLGDALDPGLAGVLAYAQKAATDPSKRLVLLSTGVVPGNSKGQQYASTYDTGRRIAEQVGATETQDNNIYAGGHPAAISQTGGFKWIQLFPPGTKDVQQMKQQHGIAHNWGFNNLSEILG